MFNYLKYIDELGYRDNLGPCGYDLVRHYAHWYTFGSCELFVLEIRRLPFAL